MVSNQPMSQQVQHSPAKPIQSGLNQHSPNHNHLARQHGSIQQSQLHSGSQSSLIPLASRPGTDVSHATGPDLKSAVVERPADSILDKASQVKQLENKTAVGNADGSETSRSSDLAISKPEIDSKSLAEGETSIGDVKENSETRETKDGLMLKQLKVAAADFQDEPEGANISKAVEGEKEVHRTEGKQNTKPNPVNEGIIADSAPDAPNAVLPLPGNNKQVEKADQGYSSRSQIIGNSSSMQAVQPISQGQLQNDVESHEKTFSLPGYHDRGLSQFPPPQSAAVGLRGISPAGPLSHERYPPQSLPHGHPSMPEAAMVSQRPSGPEQKFPHNMPQSGPSLERRFEEPFPHTISGPLTAAHGQLRPPLYAENFPYPVAADPFQPPVTKQLYGSTISPKNMEAINPFPVRGQSHSNPPISVGPGGGQIDPLARSAMGVPGYHDGRQSHRPVPGDHVPFGQPTVMQPNMMKMNGLPGIGSATVMIDSAFSHGVPDERFRPPPGERFKTLPEEGFRAAQGQFGPLMVDSGRHIANRREFEEDIKFFPRPSHLDGDGAHRFNAYVPASKPLDRGLDVGSRPFDRASMGSFPPHPVSGRFPPSSGSLEFAPLESADRLRGPLFHEDLGVKHEAHPERIRPYPEFGRLHFDSLPPRRSPGIPDGSGHFRMEPTHFRKEIDAFDVSNNRLRTSDHVGLELANNIRVGEPFGARNLSGHLRLNDSASHGPLRSGEPFGFGGYGRTPIGDSGFSNSYPAHGSVSLHGDVDSFEHLRERKNVSSGWCRLCKIDCETVEGLELHSQTKDHQNMAMEIVLSIKKENAKKHKLISEELEDTNKPRKGSFENRGGRR